MHNGFCDFNEPIRLLLLSRNNVYNKIQQIIGIQKGISVVRIIITIYLNFRKSL